MSIKIIINGALGRMGQAAIAHLTQDPQFNIVAKTTRKDNLKKIILDTHPDVILELTNADAVKKNVLTALDCNVRTVVGASGLIQTDFNSLQKICDEKKLGCIVAPNFSLGAILMMKYAAQMAQHFSHVEIIEMHHAKKLDSPSGTAIRTAELISEQTKITKSLNSKEILASARGANLDNIHIHSVRLPGLVAHQQIIFGGAGETLTIKHDAMSLDCFMPGITLACKKIMDLQTLIVGLENII